MKKIFIVILIFTSLYLLSFFILGKYSFEKRIITENNSTYNEFKWTENISIISNLKFNNLDKVVETIFEKNEKLDIHYVQNKNELINEIKKIKNYKYILYFESFTPLINLSESENIEEYVAVWNRKYIWCFWKWILISNTLEITT